MKPKKVFVILVAIVILSLSLLACSKGQATTAPVEKPVTTQEPVTSTQDTTAATSAPTGAPEDVPVMPDAYDLEVPNPLNLTYKIDLPIKDVVAFYEQELPNHGWDQINNPDTALGSMAQMSRSKTDGDRITFSLQYNPVGEFTIVQIYITRGQ